MTIYQHVPFTAKSRAEIFGGIPDTRRLHLLDLVVGPKLEECHAATQSRLAFHRKIRELAEGGQIAIVEGGMDCDCVRYEGKVSVIDADWRSVDAHMNHATEWADGPCHFTLMRPSEAREVHYRSRDLALEAFENGHPHYIASGDI